jgi:hypothetical protein
LSEVDDLADPADRVHRAAMSARRGRDRGVDERQNVPMSRSRTGET